MSYKQELTQLHQLLAHVRFYAKDELGLPAEIDDLDGYKQVGITSLDLNADIDTQLDAIMTLASDLADVMEADKRPEKPTETTTVTKATPTTQKTLLADPEASWAIGPAEVETGTAEQPDTVDSDTVTPTAAATSSEEHSPKVIGGYDQDEETARSVELVDTSLVHWKKIREQEDRKPIETWGESTTGTTDSETAQLLINGNDETDRESEESPAEAKVGEQMTLPTP